MITINSIGLDSSKAKIFADRLNILLANYSKFYQNTRGFHWNIGGENFFELHVKFEELYNDLFIKIDEIAERILTLGFIPSHNYSDYKTISTITESGRVNEGNAAVQNILAALQTIIILVRDLLKLSGNAVDKGTDAMMSDYIRMQEKLV